MAGVNVETLGIVAEFDTVEKSSDALDDLAGSADNAESKTNKFNKANKNLAGGMDKLTKKVGTLVLAYASIASLKIAGRASLELGTALAEVSTLIDGTPEQIDGLAGSVGNLSKQFGTTQTQQANAYYQAISAGAKVGKQATDLLTQANKFAIGGVTTVTTGIDALTTATNAYKASGLTAAQASDALFVGIKAGKTTAVELSSALGKIVPIASQVGVSFDETVAGIAALTTTGLSTAESVTSLNQVMVSVLKPTKEAREEAKRLKVEFNAAALSSKGLAGFMKSLKDAGGLTTSSIVKLFGSVDALKAAMALSGVTGEKYIEILSDMEVKAGATDKAFEKMSDTAQFRLNKVMSEAGAAVIKVGNGLVSVLLPALEAGVKGVKFLAENSQILGVIMLALAATQIPVVVGGLITYTAGITAAGVATGVLNGLLAATRIALAVMGGPLGIAIGLLVAVASAAALISKPMMLASGSIFSTEITTRELNKQLEFFAQTGAPSAGLAAIDLARNNQALAKSALDAAEAELFRRRMFDSAPLTKGSGDVAGIAAGIDEVRKAREALLKTNFALITTEIDVNDALRKGSAVPESDDPSSPTSGVDGGGDISEKMQGRLDALLESLMTEREALDAWKAEGDLLLEQSLAEELIGTEAHNMAKLKLEEEYQKRLSGLRGGGLENALGEAGDFFNNMIKLSGTKNKKLLGIASAVAKAEVLINTYRAAAQALADPSVPFFAKFAAVAAVLASGFGLLGSLGGGGGGAPSASGDSSSSAPSAAPSTTGEQSSEPQRIILDFQGQPFIPVEMMAEILDNIFEEAKNGAVIGIAQ